MNMKSKILGALAIAILMCTMMAGSAAAQDTMSTMSNNNMQSMNIVDVAMSDSRFSTLVKLIVAADLADTLKDTSKTFTVFAPTNDAFAKIPAAKLNALMNDKEMLRKVLLYHVLMMRVPASDVRTMMAPTAEGSSAKVKVKMKTGMAPMVMVDKAHVIQADIMASNGVIHAIDTVLMPKMNKSMSKNKSMNSTMR